MSKFIIPLSQLPPPVGASTQYLEEPITGTQKFRFRIITEDRNIISYWSPVFKIINERQINPALNQFTASAIYDSRDDYVSVALSSNSTEYTEFLKDYDIFVEWDNGGYVFYNRMNANGIKVSNSGTSTVRIKGQYPSQFIEKEDGSYEPQETSLLKVFETDELSLVDLRDLSTISASVTNVNASVIQVQQDVQNVEGLVYALS